MVTGRFSPARLICKHARRGVGAGVARSLRPPRSNLRARSISRNGLRGSATSLRARSNLFQTRGVLEERFDGSREKALVLAADPDHAVRHACTVAACLFLHSLQSGTLPFRGFCAPEPTERPSTCG